MRNMHMDVFEALRSIEVPEDKALKAAFVLSKRYEDFVKIKWDLAVLKWMVGTLYPLVIVILIRIFLYE